MVSVAIVGLGGRGRCYADYQKLNPKLMKIVAIADVNRVLVEKYKAEYSVPDDMCFNSAEELLEKDRLADAVVIATFDKEHYAHTIMAIDKGYDILLEKPISPTLAECIEIDEKAKEKGVHLRICHVLRYTEYFRKLKELVDSGVIGKVRAIENTENIAYWHYAHSFVRRIWGNSKKTSSIILQKCCHDTDILTWLIDKKPVKVTSMGGLSYFTKENAPKGSPERCGKTCPEYYTCPYNAERFYLTEGYMASNEDAKNKDWMYKALCSGTPSEDGIKKSLKNTDFGKCVFKCDNDVCDHQSVVIEYEDGTIVTHTLSAFTQECYRATKIFGTLGEIEANDNDLVVRIKKFDGGALIRNDRTKAREEVIDVESIATDLTGHNGGDNGLMKDFLTYVDERKNGKCTKLRNEDVMVSHKICFAAEESRLNGGTPIEIK